MDSRWNGIVLLGGPGSGKGTQAVQLAKALCVAHISTGELFRENIKQGTELGTLAKSYIERGELVPDEVVIAIAKDAVQRDGESGFILDGFPRTVAQAEALDKVLGELGTPLQVVVNLQAPEDILVRRLSGRRLCGRI